MPQGVDEAGNVWELDAQGNPTTLVRAASGPADPSFPYEGPKAEVDIASAKTSMADTAADNARADKQLEAELFSKGLRIGANGKVEAIPGWTPPTKDSKDTQKNANLEALTAQINRVQKLYNETLKGTGVVQAIGEYLPTQSNKAFDAAAAGLAEQGLAAFRVPGVGSQSDTELRQFVEANKPSTSAFDSANEERLRQLRSRVDATRQEMGLPPAQWEGLPKAEEEDRKVKASAFSLARQMQDDPLVAAAFGAGTTTVPIPPQMQQEHSAFIARGGFTPDEYAQFRAQLDRKYNLTDPPASKMEEYRSVAPEILKVLEQGGDIGTIPAPERVMSGGEILRNNMANNPLGALLIGAGNMGSIGGVEALSGDQYGALKDARPNWTMAGEILGAVGGTSGLGAIGRNTVGRAAPSMLGGQGGAQFARNLATDTAYGAGYGATTQGDPLEGGILGAAGSVGGQAFGKGLGAAVGGLARTGPAAAMREAGVRLTGGQLIGGPMKGIEDRMMSIPVIGDMVRGRRLEGMQDFNQAAFRRAGEPIGANVSEAGERGLAQLYDPQGGGAINQAYDDAVRGVTVPLDPQFRTDMAKVAQARNTLPPDYAARFDKVGENRIGPIVDAGQMTGNSYQQAMRALKASKASASGAAPGFENEYKDALSSTMGVLDDQMMRGGSPEVLSGLSKANEAYRRFKVLEDSVGRARNGTRTGEPGVFAPSQLNDALYASGKKYGAPPADMKDLADAGQRVLPSTIPNSGTADRLAQMALPGVLLGGAGGGALLGDDPMSGAATGAGGTLSVAAILALGGTKQGQAILRNMWTVRPESARKAGEFIGKRAGLFGHAALPATL